MTLPPEIDPGRWCTRPELPRPCKVPGYLVLAAIIVAAVIYLVGNAFITVPVWTGVTFAIVLAGVPVYLVAFKTPGSGIHRPRSTSR